MERIPFLLKTAAATLFVFFFGLPKAEAQEDEGFTMSSGALLGGANGTHGA
jgi:hypothetical protein